MVLAVELAGLILLSGIRLRWVISLAVAAAAAVTAVLSLHLLKGYQLTRLTSFLHPSSNAAGAGYNEIQAKIAIGSGGMFGEGLFHGQSVSGSYVPAQSTDFIFTVAGQELGFVGAVVIVARSAWWCPRAAHRDPRGRSVRHAGGRGHRDLVPVPVVREHRHDRRHHADHRAPVAVHLLRRLRHLRRHDRHRHPAVRPPQAPVFE